VFEDVVDILDPEMNIPDDEDDENDYYEDELETQSTQQPKTEASAAAESDKQSVSLLH
jgi:hypothetical protein